MNHNSPLLELPLLLPAQAQKHVTHNEALLRLDALAQLSVIDYALQTPPVSPSSGDRYLVPSSTNGQWIGHENEIALFDGNAWRFLSPKAGWRVELPSEARSLMFDGVEWKEPFGATENIPGIGINMPIDETSRLAVAADCSTFSHEGGGHQVKVNKASPLDTASLLFQSDWIGYAEFGLNGANHLSLKVSDDGSDWKTSFAVDPTTGHLSGAAVQSSESDVTAGKLMRADFGYSRGNVLGEVSQSGGLPTGALVERGDGPNGQYVRYADGLQICMTKLTLALNAYNNVTADWDFPKPFAKTPNVNLIAPNSGSSFVNCGAAQFGLARQGGGTTSVGLTLTGLVTLSQNAEVRDVRVTALGQWY
ncbi:DUF2793 domain-containing protein [Rhodobacteraceae bacterium R_SAG9]|nr:DUF2793 domain-containing protein [Rhodobacteraceae bacterium R_SAG9]